MSANRLHPQGSGNSRGTQAAVVHSATFWPSSNSNNSSSFHTLSDLQDSNVDNNNNNNASHHRQHHQHQQRPAWSMVPNAASFTSLQELYGQEVARASSMQAQAPVKAESSGALMDQHHNSFLQCRGSDQLDLNYGWERYISS